MVQFIDALDAEIADLERQLEANPIYIKLKEARRLRAVYAGEVAVRDVSLDRAAASETPKPSDAKKASLTAIEASEIALESAGRPVPTLELLEMIRPMGVVFGGKTPQNSLSSILSKSELFQPNGRAGWTLTKNNPETKATDDDSPGEEASSALFDTRLFEPGTPPAQGRQAGPGGGT